MKHLDLCSGIGGFSLAFESQGFETVGFAEVDPFCSQVLKKNWPTTPNYGNVKDIADDPTTLPDFDVLTAGYPCQPFSAAGKKRGEHDPRHLWPDIRRIVQARRPSWCVFENVLGHVSMGLDKVLSNLEDDGYKVRPFVVPALSVDANHRRDRVWIVAHTSGLLGNVSPEYTKQGERQAPKPREGGSSELVAHTDRPLSQGGGLSSRGEAKHAEPFVPSRWPPEPPVGRVANGLPNQSHRLKALGNAIVPQVAERIAYCIREASSTEQD